MRKMRSLMMLTCALLALAICACGQAWAEADAPAWYYYGTGGMSEVIETDFDLGVVLKLNDLRGFNRIGVKIGDSPLKTMDWNPDEDSGEVRVEGQDLKATGRSEAAFKLLGYRSDAQDCTLWQGVIRDHDCAAAAEPVFCLLALDPVNSQDASRIGGSARCGNSLQVYVGDEEIGECKLDPSGRFSLESPGALRPGSVLCIVVRESYDDAFLQSVEFTLGEDGRFTGAVYSGSETQEEIITADSEPVQSALSFTEPAAAYAPIAAEGGRTEIVVTTRVATHVLNGVGEPGMNILMSLDGGAETLFATVRADGGWSGNLDPLVAGEDGRHVLQLYYPEDKASALMLTAIVDRHCALQMELCEDGQTSVQGISDPYAVVVLNGGIQATADVDGRFVIQLPEPLREHQELSLTATDPYDNAAIPVMNAVPSAAGVKITLAVKKNADGSVQFDGTAKRGAQVEILANGAVIGTAEAAQNTAFAYDWAGSTLVEGENSFQARYAGGRFPEYASDAVMLNHDTQKPELTLDQTAFNTLNTLLTGRVSEPAFVLAKAGGETFRTETDAVGGFALEIPRQAQGAQIEILAVDAASQASDSIFLTVEAPLSYLAWIDAPQQGSLQAFTEKMRVSGYVICADALEGLHILSGDVLLGKAALSEAEMTEETVSLAAGRMEPMRLVRFEANVDAGRLPLGGAELSLETSEGAEILLTAPVSVEIQKPGNYLPGRFLTLTVLAAGCALFVLSWLRVGRQLRALDDSAEDETDSRGRRTLKNHGDD